MGEVFAGSIGAIAKRFGARPFHRGDRQTVREPGDERLITLRGSGAVRRKLEDAIKRAAVEPWDKLFQSLRSSCEKEWP
jgi:hypothetical protein